MLGKVEDLPKIAKLVSVEMRFKSGPGPELLNHKVILLRLKWRGAPWVGVLRPLAIFLETVGKPLLSSGPSVP